MFSYLFSASKKPEPVLVTEPVTEPVQNTLEAENEQLKAQIQVLLAEKATLEKLVEHLRRDSAVYRDLMFTKVCNCNN